MTGLCGVLGGRDHEIDAMADDLIWTTAEYRSEHIDNRISVHGAFHSERNSNSQPAAINDEVFVWAWGSVYGFNDGNRYRSREQTDVTAAEYCAALYEKHGSKFVAGLNGSFVGVVYDRADRTVSLFSDRLLSRDVYYTTGDDGAVVFSSRIQSLSLYPAVTPAFDAENLAEYMAYRRSFGAETPLEGVHRLAPASMRTFDLDTGNSHGDTYWSPHRRPINKPLSYFVDEFVDRFRAALAERVDPERSYGILLSGGSDSRLLLAAMSEYDVTAYHLADWMGPEARIAERVALTAGVDFELLQRDRGYHRRSLKRNPSLSNFVGTFNQAHAEGFMNRLREEVDVVMTAHLSDALFKGLGVPTQQLTLGPIGTLQLPVAKKLRTIEDLIKERATDLSHYFDVSHRVEEILSRNMFIADSTIQHHGIEYDTLQDLIVSETYYPETNAGSCFRPSVVQNTPYRNPFFDNRLVELHLTLPQKYLLRRNIIGRALERINPDLASIPHATTGAPVGWPFAASYVSEQTRAFLRRHTSIGEPPRPYLGNGPWTNHAELIRHDDFVLDTILEHRETIEALSFLDWGGVLECYREHLAGVDNTIVLYTLLTLLEMPVTERIVAARSQ
jgi:asparagine synthase (glutamine-hydrolysing)